MGKDVTTTLVAFVTCLFKKCLITKVVGANKLLFVSFVSIIDFTTACWIRIFSFLNLTKLATKCYKKNAF